MVKMREENGVQLKTYERGYPVGFKAAIEEGGEEKYFLHNHLRFTVLYHKDMDTDLSRIVGFEVEPFSVKHEYEQQWDPVKPLLDTCNPGRMVWVTHGLAPQLVEENEEVIFSYDVIFKVPHPIHKSHIHRDTHIHAQEEWGIHTHARIYFMSHLPHQASD
jgi:transmembrane 9 superfamily protein 2/4